MGLAEDVAVGVAVVAVVLAVALAKADPEEWPTARCQGEPESTAPSERWTVFRRTSSTLGRNAL